VLKSVTPGHDSQGACRVCPAVSNADFEVGRTLPSDLSPGEKLTYGAWVHALGPLALNVSLKNEQSGAKSTASPVDLTTDDGWQQLQASWTIPEAGAYVFNVHAAPTTPTSDACFDFDDVTLQ